MKKQLLEKGMLESVQRRFMEVVTRRRLMDARVLVSARPLTPEEAIGNPERRDYPIILGKERVVEARVFSSRGHAFTDSPGDYLGVLGDIVGLPLSDNRERAIFIATLNAVLAELDIITGSVHCKDEEPEICARTISKYLLEKHGAVSVGMIGLNPAIAENLVTAFGRENVRISDLNPGNIGKDMFGVTIFDGALEYRALIRESDVLVITGTTLVNDTFDAIHGLCRELGKPFYLYGVTCAGVSRLTGLPRLCPCAHPGKPGT